MSGKEGRKARFKMVAASVRAAISSRRFTGSFGAGGAHVRQRLHAGVFAYTGGPSSWMVLPREDREGEELLDGELKRTEEPLNWGRRSLTEGLTTTTATVTECYSKVTVHSFSGILRDGCLSMVFSRCRDLSML